MAISKQKKKEIVENATEIVKKSLSSVFVSFKGMKVMDVTSMRKDLKKNGISYHVLKKTLLKRAAEAAKVEGEMPALEGAIAVAYLSAEALAKEGGEDLLAPAREIYSFQKKFKENLSIVGGIFEGKFMDKVAMLSIATIPPLQILRGQFVNLINSPIQGFVIALNAIASKKN